ncbi:uncharacterized protein Dana_GF19603 [Drosophila ananassae]|uniref:cAMP-specific 3',5'-cyclic phosphodiesterase n=1 Tax=Drosophila ananassae TaxID=7217 RepID=B3N1V2_DROAN|nr:uncharacterized protein Dana_GF19603 [Drosophila ananassae]
MSGENGNGGGANGSAPPQPPQYIITTPSEADAEEIRSMGDLEVELDLGSPDSPQSTQTLVQSQRISSSSTTTKVATRSYSMTSSSAASGMSAMQQLQQSLQSSAMVGEVVISGGGGVGVASASGSHLLGGAGTLNQQLKAQSSTSIITSSEQRTSTSTSSSSSTRYIGSATSTSSASASGSGSGSGSGSTTGGKSRFQSFLQQPEGAHGFLTAHQKHVRQFVRSTSAHSEAAAGVAQSRPEKCIRSASTQIDDAGAESGGGGGGGSTLGDSSSAGGSMTLSMSSKLGLQQSSSILISKSAETIEMKSSSSSAGMRTQLTLSGGFLAPPGSRKITILSPIHAPPGLHDMLKRSQGRSPLSPRISFPGSDTDLFGSLLFIHFNEKLFQKNNF